MQKTRIVLFSALLLWTVTSAFAQITDVQLGAANDPGSPCGANGTLLSAVGNPAPSYQLQKPCATSNDAASFADVISPVEGGPVSALTSAGFDIKNGTHCGAGAPRFELDLDSEAHFVIALGCAGGTLTDLGNGWTRVTFSQAQIQAGVLSAGGTPASILTDAFILFDEGTDTPASALIGTPGTADIDNAMVNGATFGGAPGSISSVPTLSTYVLFALAGFLAFAGVFLLRR